MKIIKLDKTNFDWTVRSVKKVLQVGGLVVLPSDTAYGLAADACSEKAIQKVYDFKGRRFAKGLSVFLNNFREIKKYAVYSHSQEKLIKTLLPGPFTVILKSRGKVAPAVEPGDGTLGVRLIGDELVRAITRSVSFPITATSANLSGKGPHFSVSSFLKTLSKKKREMIGLVVDAGSLPRRPTSTLVRLMGDQVKVLREGALNLKLLRKDETKSEAGTKRLAQELYRQYLSKKLENKAVVVIIKGDLGVGKTVFAQGIGEILGLKLTSPTFVLMNEYQVGRIPGMGRAIPRGGESLQILYHLDLFRIESEEEIADLKLEKFLKKGNLLLIEWGEKLSIFEKLKRKWTVFYLLQIEELSQKKRRFCFYQL